MCSVSMSTATPALSATSRRLGLKTTTASSVWSTPARRARSAASSGPVNATSAAAAPRASATIAASIPLASGEPSPLSCRSSSHPASRTAAARRLVRVASSSSATVAGPSSEASWRAARRSSACSGVSRVSTSAGQDRDSGGTGCAVELGVADARLTGHLSIAGLPAQLEHDLVHLAQTRRADGLAVGDEPAVGVDRERTVDLERAVGHQFLLVTVGAEAVLGQVDDL